MSKITLEPNNSGSGTFTIAAPNSNNNRQIDLPDLAGTVLTDATDLEPQVKTSLNATGDAPLFACRAFVNFDGTGTVSIRDSGNVSSITDNGTGDYTVNFATAMPDANYSVSFSLSLPNNNDPQPVLGSFSLTPSQTVGSLRVYALAGNVTRDADNFHITIFR